MNRCQIPRYVQRMYRNSPKPCKEFVILSLPRGHPFRMTNTHFSAAFTVLIHPFRMTNCCKTLSYTFTALHFHSGKLQRCKKFIQLSAIEYSVSLSNASSKRLLFFVDVNAAPRVRQVFTAPRERPEFGRCDKLFCRASFAFAAFTNHFRVLDLCVFSLRLLPNLSLWPRC